MSTDINERATRLIRLVSILHCKIASFSIMIQGSVDYDYELKRTVLALASAPEWGNIMEDLGYLYTTASVAESIRSIPAEGDSTGIQQGDTHREASFQDDVKQQAVKVFLEAFPQDRLK